MMTNQPAIDTVSQEAFEEAVQKYISWATPALPGDGALPADTFFGVWADLQREKKPIEVVKNKPMTADKMAHLW